MSELFTDLSAEQQELVAGGGPTLGAVEDLSLYTANQAPAFSASTAGPTGASSTGFAAPIEINTLAAQLALGASGNPTFPSSSFPSVPSVAGAGTGTNSSGA